MTAHPLLIYLVKQGRAKRLEWRTESPTCVSARSKDNFYWAEIHKITVGWFCPKTRYWLKVVDGNSHTTEFEINEDQYLTLVSSYHENDITPDEMLDKLVAGPVLKRGDFKIHVENCTHPLELLSLILSYDPFYRDCCVKEVRECLNDEGFAAI